MRSTCGSDHPEALLTAEAEAETGAAETGAAEEDEAGPAAEEDEEAAAAGEVIGVG